MGVEENHFDFIDCMTLEYSHNCLMPELNIILVICVILKWLNFITDIIYLVKLLSERITMWLKRKACLQADLVNVYMLVNFLCVFLGVLYECVCLWYVFLTRKKEQNQKRGLLWCFSDLHQFIFCASVLTAVSDFCS